MSNSLILRKIAYAKEKKDEIKDIVGLTGNPTWDTVIDAINNPAGEITNVSINSSRVASWTAPTINVDSSLNPSISYLMYVNGRYIGTTGETSYDLTSYLAEGQNTFSVKARIEFNNKDFSESNTITITFNYSVNLLSGDRMYDSNDSFSYNCITTSYNGKCYLFNSLQDGKSVEITISNNGYSIETISGITRPNGYDSVANAAYCTISNRCYIFGGGCRSEGSPTRNTIAKIFLDYKTVSYANAVMPDSFAGGCAVAKGTDIYIFGGYFSNNGTDNPNLKVYKYSILTDTLTEMNASFPSIPLVIFCNNCIAIGNYIYINAHKLNALYRYDTVNDILEEVVSNLATVLGSYSYRDGTVVMNTLANGNFINFGNDVFLFGIETIDYSSDPVVVTNKVFKFIAETNQFVDCSSLFTFDETYSDYSYLVRKFAKVNNDEMCFFNNSVNITLITRNKNVSV